MIVHGLDQHSDRVWWRVLTDAVPEVEDMTRVRPEFIEHLLRLGFDGRGRREQHARIEVALQRDTLTDALARRPDAGRPVEPDDIGAACRDLFEPLPALVNTIAGTRRPSCSRFSLASTRCV